MVIKIFKYSTLALSMKAILFTFYVAVLIIKKLARKKKELTMCKHFTPERKA